MDLNDSNKTNEVTSARMSLIDGTSLDDININRNKTGSMSEHSSLTSGSSPAVHVELLPSSGPPLNIIVDNHIDDRDKANLSENNENDKLIVDLTDEKAQSRSGFGSAQVQTESTPDPFDLTITDQSVDSLVINTPGSSPVQTTSVNVRSNPGNSKRVRFKKGIASSTDPDARHEITISNSLTIPDHDRLTSATTSTNLLGDIENQSTRKISDFDHDLNLEHIELNETSACLDNYEHNNDSDDDGLNRKADSEFGVQTTIQGKHSSNLLKPSCVGRIYNRLTNINLLRTKPSQSKLYKYSRHEDQDLLKESGRSNNAIKIKPARTFRGSYKYHRSGVKMAVLKESLNLLSLKSTYALFGAFLIHVTLGTVYTLSNVNSYMTSYMRIHGSPKATYGAAVWLSSSYSVGQGVSMVIGGYLEKRFSARFSCIIGCAIHSISIISTSWTIDYGLLPVLLSYGVLPGFGCGLAYMTPMSNGFAWFPNRRGLVAGVILAGFGIGTFVFNMAQTGYVNPLNLSPIPRDDGYFTQKEVLDRVPHLFTFLGSIYASMQFIGCLMLFPPPRNFVSDERPIIGDNHTELDVKSAIKTPEFKVLFIVYGLTTQGVLFINSILKEYGQIFIRDDSYLAWVGSMASIANSLGRLIWGLAIDRYSFTFCFTCITAIFTCGLFLTPFKFILSSKLLYLICTLVMFGSFSGWMSSYPVHLSRVYGRTNSGMIYGLIYISQAFGGVVTAFGTHYLIDNYNRFVPFYCICSMELLGLLIYLIYYPKNNNH